MIKKLIWDSEFFGYRIGSCTGKLMKGKNAGRFREEFEREKFACVYIFCGKKQKFSAVFNKQGNFLPVGGHARFELLKKDWQKKVQPPSLDIRLLNKRTINNGSAAEIKKLAKDLAPISRFYQDKRLRPRLGKMYKIWADKIIKEKKGLMAVKLIDGRVAGLVGCLLNGNEAQVALVKTGRKYEGRGVASQLMAYSIEKLFAGGAKKIVVVTQADNEAAKRLYQKFGFKIKTITRIYHYWKK